jgi:hypothetical protein
MTRYGWLFWFPLVAVICVIVYELLLFRKRKLYRRKKKDTAAKIAHTKFVRNLPEYKKARRRYNVLLFMAAILYVAAGSALTYLTARPISVTESKEEKENRDIIFCLDVSGSMNSYVEDLSDAFINLVKKMDGERFGITIFDGDYATLSPLSDDYSSLLNVLEELKDSHNFNNYAKALATAGNSYGAYSSSEIGAGLVGCVDSFDRLEEVERSRVVILATDNKAPTTPIITLTQAAQYAKERDITIYGMNILDLRSQDTIDTGTYGKYDDASAIEFQEATITTGGAYYTFGDERSAASGRIIGQIMSQEAARYEGAGQLIRNDVPQIAAIVSAILLVLLVMIIWRLYL